MTRFTEARHPGEFLISEASGNRSRDAIVIAAEQSIQPGQMLAGRAIPANVTAVTSVVAGNTGNATIALASPAVSAAVKPGIYRGIATAATTVKWEDPDGVAIGNSTHGTAFNKAVKFTITAGGTATVVGDVFEVAVSIGAGDLEYAAYDPAVDGVDAVRAVAFYGAETGVGETASITAITRDAEVAGVCLEFLPAVTADQRAEANASLRASGIIVR
ncbi:head decoration protein [Pseudochelatococcus sp. G4_1912]|uniref:head decoration protein n=1 Tax=Pseudochelatococcus sp. G4_1912 TaxID=3114288 RepID=UPI0039C731AC